MIKRFKNNYCRGPIQMTITRYILIFEDFDLATLLLGDHARRGAARRGAADQPLASAAAMQQQQQQHYR